MEMKFCKEAFSSGESHFIFFFVLYFLELIVCSVCQMYLPIAQWEAIFFSIWRAGDIKKEFWAWRQGS